MTDVSPPTLKQRYLYERREFTLEPDRIHLFVKDLNGEIESHVQYETLTSTTRSISRQDGRVYMVAISCGIFALVGFILNFVGLPVLMRWAPLWAIAAIILFGFHLYKRRRYILVDLSDHKSIFFLANNPSKGELDRFIQSMHAARKRYLREKYYTINLTGDASSELARLQWLFREGAITDIELQEMKMLFAMQKA